MHDPRPGLYLLCPCSLDPVSVVMHSIIPDLSRTPFMCIVPTWSERVARVMSGMTSYVLYGAAGFGLLCRSVGGAGSLHPAGSPARNISASYGICDGAVDMSVKPFAVRACCVVHIDVASRSSRYCDLREAAREGRHMVVCVYRRYIMGRKSRRPTTARGQGT